MSTATTLRPVLRLGSGTDSVAPCLTRPTSLPTGVPGGRWIRASRTKGLDGPAAAAVRQPAVDRFHGRQDRRPVLGRRLRALLSESTQNVDDVPPEALAGGMAGWATSGSPWSHLVDRDRYRRVLDGVRRLEPSYIFSSHLPAPSGMSLEKFLGSSRPFPTPSPRRPSLRGSGTSSPPSPVCRPATARCARRGRLSTLENRATALPSPPTVAPGQGGAHRRQPDGRQTPHRRAP